MPITKEELQLILDSASSPQEISSISSDGKNLSSRIPKKISQNLRIKKGDKFKWLIEDKKIKLEVIRD
jgi:hypothetical protein